MANWDIFHSDRLEVERNLTEADVRAKMTRGEIRKDDLARPAGSRDPWTRLTELAELTAGPRDSLEIDAKSREKPGEASLQSLLENDDDDEDDFEEPKSQKPAPKTSRTSGAVPPASVPPMNEAERDLAAFPDDYDAGQDLDLRSPAAKISLPVDDEDIYDPQAEDEDAAGFTLARGSATTVEELDLAAMVDVAFQLVLFFLVTASTIVFKTLEVPKPNPEKGRSSVQTSSPAPTLEKLKEDYILVDIDASGNVKVDREPAPNDFDGLAARLRKLKNESGRTGMLFTADATTKHKYAVLAYDIANEIGLRISIGQPKAAPDKPPVPAAQPKRK